MAKTKLIVDELGQQKSRSAVIKHLSHILQVDPYKYGNLYRTLREAAACCPESCVPAGQSFGKLWVIMEQHRKMYAVEVPDRDQAAAIPARCFEKCEDSPFSVLQRYHLEYVIPVWHLKQLYKNTVLNRGEDTVAIDMLRSAAAWRKIVLEEPSQNLVRTRQLTGMDVYVR